MCEQDKVPILSTSGLNKKKWSAGDWGEQETIQFWVFVLVNYIEV